MRFQLALVSCVLAAGCAAQPDSPAPQPFAAAPSESAPTASAVDTSAALLSEPERGLLESRLDAHADNFTPSEPIGEAQEPISWGIIIGAACLLAGAWASEYGCKRHVLEKLCPPGTVMTKTIHDTMDKNQSVTVRLPCDALETMVCGTAAASGGEIMRRLCTSVM